MVIRRFYPLALHLVPLCYLVIALDMPLNTGHQIHVISKNTFQICDILVFFVVHSNVLTIPIMQTNIKKVYQRIFKLLFGKSDKHYFLMFGNLTLVCK